MLFCIKPSRCAGFNVVRYVVDAADAERIPESKEELFELLDRPVLAGIPLLVLGNKNDLPEAITVEKLIDEMYLSVKWRD